MSQMGLDGTDLALRAVAAACALGSTVGQNEIPLTGRKIVADIIRERQAVVAQVAAVTQTCLRQCVCTLQFLPGCLGRPQAGGRLDVLSTPCQI